MKQKIVLTLKILTLCLCLLMVFAGGINDGMTGFFWALPFVIIGFFVLIFTIKQMKVHAAFAVYCLLCYGLNLTMMTNERFYPQIKKEIVTKKEFKAYKSKEKFCTGIDDGYVYIEPKIANDLYDQATKTCALEEITIKEGTKLVGAKIHYNFPDFGAKGFLGLKDFEGRLVYVPEKNMAEFIGYERVERDPILRWNNLMYYPMLPVIGSSIVSEK